eukprot:scaffold2861_cov209-Alexandrium_tamarense.AAC.1
MTRTGLDWEGVPSNKLVSGLSCANMSVILTFWMAMNASALFMFRVKWERGMDFGSPYIAGLVLFNVITWIYLMNITKNVRESIRNKYQIPEERCIGCEDCMCATFCTSCTICQMGRHTADFETYRASCCTKTGLPRNVELAQVGWRDDDDMRMERESDAAWYLDGSAVPLNQTTLVKRFPLPFEFQLEAQAKAMTYDCLDVFELNGQYGSPFELWDHTSCKALFDYNAACQNEASTN